MKKKKNVETYVKNALVAVHYLCDRFDLIYHDQPAFKKLLAATRRAVKRLGPVEAMFPDLFFDPFDSISSAIGDHASCVAVVCPNAGWFVAEIDHFVSDTAYNLNPDNGFDRDFFIPDTMTKEQVEAIRRCFVKCSNAFCGKINADITSDAIQSNPFNL